MLTLTALALLAAEPTLPPLVQAEPEAVQVSTVRASTVPRQATLLDEEPSTAGALFGRAVMAPVLGAIGGGLGAAIGGLGGYALAGGGWGGLAVAILAGGLVAAVGLAVGVALGAALFSDDIGTMFKRSLGWGFLAAGIVGAAVLLAIALPAIGLVIGIGASVVACAAVPLVVESRRLAVAAEARERSAVPVATF